MRTMYFPIKWMVFHKTSHTLNFCIDKTEAKLPLFRECAPADFIPMELNQILIKFRNFPNGKLKTLDAFCIRFARCEKRFLENRLYCIKFAHKRIIALAKVL